MIYPAIQQAVGNTQHPWMGRVGTAGFGEIRICERIGIVPVPYYIDSVKEHFIPPVAEAQESQQLQASGGFVVNILVSFQVHRPGIDLPAFMHLDTVFLNGLTDFQRRILKSGQFRRLEYIPEEFCNMI